MPAKRPAPRLPVLDEAHMNGAARAMEAIRSGPRGKSIVPRGPFADLAACAGIRAIGAGLRRTIAVIRRRCRRACPNSPSAMPRGSGARSMKWFRARTAALAAGVKPKTIQDLRAGRVPKSAAKDERAVYRDFIQEIYKKRRVSGRRSAYKRRRRAATIRPRYPRLLRHDLDDVVTEMLALDRGARRCTRCKLR